MKRILTLQKMVMEGETVPRGYGIAYRDFVMSYTAVAYPLPLNWVVRAWRAVMWRLKIPRGGFEKEKQAIWQAGFEKGQQAGRSEATRLVPELVSKEIERQLVVEQLKQ